MRERSAWWIQYEKIYKTLHQVSRGHKATRAGLGEGSLAAAGTRRGPCHSDGAPAAGLSPGRRRRPQCSPSHRQAGHEGLALHGAPPPARAVGLEGSAPAPRPPPKAGSVEPWGWARGHPSMPSHLKK